MEKTNKNTIEINFKDNNIKNENSIFSIMGNIITSILVYIIVFLNLIYLFNIDIFIYTPLIIGTVLILSLEYYSKYNKSKLFKLIGVVLVLSFLIIQSKYIKNGLFLNMNQIRDIVGINTGYIMREYSINIDKELIQRSIRVFWILISIIVGYLSFLSIKKNKNIIIWILIIPIFIFQVILGIMPNNINNILLILATILVISNSFLKPLYNDGFNINTTSIRLNLIIFLILIFMIFSFLIFIIFPSSNYIKNSKIIDFKNIIISKIEDYRYEKVKTNSFTQGDFNNLKDLKLTDKEALEIKMDNPDSMYLKGYIGSQYTPSRWEDLENEIYYKSYPLFYWLDKSNFEPINQLSLVNELVIDSDENSKININIKNINANSKYLYTPYEFDSIINTQEILNNNLNEKLISKSFKGMREYSYISNKNLVTKYPKLANNIYKMKDKDSLDKYIENEGYYNEFVYENYLHIPKDIEELMKKHIGNIINDTDSHIPYEIAIDEIKSYFKENIIYNENPDTVLEGEDFLKFFLEDSKEGYSAHYATTGTLMFRYLGIPSRYVEGYLVTPEDIEDVSPMEPITISGKNAHTWTEIYIDQLGWIPIELTPPYEDIMPPINMSEYPSGENINNNMSNNSGQSDYEEGLQEIVDDEEVESRRPENKKKDKFNLIKVMKIIFVLLLLISILFCIIHLIKKGKKLKTLKNSFIDSNYKKAIPKIFSYAMYLLNYNENIIEGGSIYSYIEEIENIYSDKYIDAFKEATKINQKALYSNSEIEKEEYNYMIKFKNQILYDFVESKNIFQRIKLKVWDCIY